MATRVAGVLAATAVGLAPASAAWAQTTFIPIQPGQVPTTAADFQPQNCESFPGIQEDQDGWFFVLTGFEGDDEDLDEIVLTLRFRDTANNVQTLTIPGPANFIQPGMGGVVQFPVVTPAGWTLVNEQPLFTGVTVPNDLLGVNPQFVLSHTCPGDVIPPPPPPPHKKHLLKLATTDFLDELRQIEGLPGLADVLEGLVSEHSQGSGWLTPNGSGYSHGPGWQAPDGSVAAGDGGALHRADQGGLMLGGLGALGLAAVGGTILIRRRAAGVSNA